VISTLKFKVILNPYIRTTVKSTSLLMRRTFNRPRDIFRALAYIEQVLEVRLNLTSVHNFHP
jgi:hypothetical protein